MEILVRWDDGVQNIVPSTDLRKVNQTNKNWKRTRLTQKFKEGDRIKMWFDDKWCFGIILFVDRAHVLSDYPSVLPPDTPVKSGNSPETLINKEASVEEAPVFNDDTNGSGNLNIEDASVEEGAVFNDDTNSSGNLNIVLSEPFTLVESFNFNEKDCEESNENNSLEGDKTLNDVKTVNKNISPIRTRRKQYLPVKLSTRKPYNSYKYKVKTKTIPPDNNQATSKTKILPDLLLKPCSVVVDDSVAKQLAVSGTYRVCQSKLGGVGSALAEAESVAKPVLTKQMEKKPSMRSTTTVTRASLRRSNQKYELVQLGHRRRAPSSKQKQVSATKKPSHLSKKSLKMDFYEQNLLKLFNKSQIMIPMEKKKVGITQNLAEEPITSDGGESSGGVLTNLESHFKNNIKKTPDQETKLIETEKDLPKKTYSNKTEQAIEFCDEIPAKKIRKALTTAEYLDQNLSILNCSDQSKTQTPQSSRGNENNSLRIPPSLEIILKDSSDTGKTSTTRTGSLKKKMNESGETQPMSVQVFIKDPKTKSVISEADLADIRRNAKPNVKSDSSNRPKTKLEFTRSLVPFIPPMKYSETVLSSMQTKQTNLDSLNKNKLVYPSTKRHDTEIICKSLMTSDFSERSRLTTKSMKSQNSVNSSYSPQTSDSEMTLNDLLNSSEVTDIARKGIDDKSEESQEENTSDSVLTLEELLKSGDAVSLDHKYNELKNRLSSPALLLSSLRIKKIIHPPKPTRMNNSTNQLIENKKLTDSLQTSNNSSHLEKPSQVTGSENGMKEVGKPAEPDVEDCLDGVPPFIRDVFECGNIRDGFIASDLVFVLSLLPDIEEMTDSQKIKFQVKVIEMLNDVMNDPHLTYC